MAKFKKRPDNRTFEHVQFYSAMTQEALIAAGGCLCAEGGGTPHVHTIHAGQTCTLEDGDWIAPEPDGIHYYPIKDDIHGATYIEAEGE